MDLIEEEILGDSISTHWYYQSKAKALQRLLPEIGPDTTILDVGAGSGFFSRYLLARSVAREAWCVDIGYERDWDGSECGKPIRYRQSIDASSADLVLLMDVLEHVDDDLDLLKSYVEIAPGNSKFFISVPAFQSLWSSHDDFLGHRRRYRLKDVKKLAHDAGLMLVSGNYYFANVLPMAVFMRLFDDYRPGGKEQRSQLRKHGRAVNGFLSMMCNAEFLFMKRNKIAGLSVLLLAEKRS